MGQNYKDPLWRAKEVNMRIETYNQTYEREVVKLWNETLPAKTIN